MGLNFFYFLTCFHLDSELLPTTKYQFEQLIFSLKCVWQQVSSGLQDSSQYSSWSLKWSGLDGLDSPSTSSTLFPWFLGTLFHLYIYNWMKTNYVRNSRKPLHWAELFFEEKNGEKGKQIKFGFSLKLVSPGLLKSAVVWKVSVPLQISNVESPFLRKISNPKNRKKRTGHWDDGKLIDWLV